MTESTRSGEANDLRQNVLKGGALLTLGKAVAQGSSFARNVIVARIVGVENFGIAAIFVVTISIFDMIGNLSVDRLLVQANDGDNKDFQATAHMVQGIRGMISGLVMLAASGLLAKLFAVPNTSWAFAFLALVPLFKGFTHLDVQRIQRGLKYEKSVAVEIAQQLIPALLAWPIAIWIRDYSAMLWLILIQCFVGMVGSFLASERPYRWQWNSLYAKRFFDFGWPLFANGILLFGIYQGDRFLLSTAGRSLGSHIYTLTDFGIFAVATSLTLTPMVAISTICSSLMLPLYSGLKENKVIFLKRYEFGAQLVGLVSGYLAIPLILAGTNIVVLIYGKSYRDAGSLVGWMAAAQAIRMARFSPAMGAMAFGDTANTMYSNVIRFAALAGTFGVIMVGGPLIWIAMLGFFGEFLALIFCFWKLQKDHFIPMWSGLKSTLPLCVVMVLATLVSLRITTASTLLHLALVLAVAAVYTFSMFVVFPSIRTTFSAMNLRGA